MDEKVIFETDFQSYHIGGGLMFSPLRGTEELLPPDPSFKLIVRYGSPEGREMTFQCNRERSGYFTIGGSAWRKFAKNCCRPNIDAVTLSKRHGEPFYIIRVRVV